MNYQYFKENNELTQFYRELEEQKKKIRKELEEFLSMVYEKYSAEEILNKINAKIGDVEFFDLLADSLADDEEFHDIIYFDGDNVEDKSASEDESYEFNEAMAVQIYDVDLEINEEPFQTSVTAETSSEAKKMVQEAADKEFKDAKVKVLRATRTSSAKNGLNQYTPMKEAFIEEASINTYDKFIERTRQDFGDLISETQSELNNSESKAEDYYILNCFWGNFMPEAVGKWEDSSALFLDDESMYPAPESVAKQFVTRLFDVRNLNVLYDIPIDQGFDDWEVYVDCVNAENPRVSKDEAVAEYEQMFSEEEPLEEPEEEN